MIASTRMLIELPGDPWMWGRRAVRVLGGVGGAHVGESVGVVAGQTKGNIVNTVEVGYRPPQVCFLIGITYRQLDYWARTDLLRPSITEARGSGTQRRYSFGDLLQLAVVKHLLDAGVSLLTCRRAIAELGSSPEELAESLLVISSGRVQLVTTGDELIAEMRSGSGVLNVCSDGPDCS